MEIQPLHPHLAVLVVLFTALTGAVYWAIHIIGDRRARRTPHAGIGQGPVGGRLALALITWYGVALAAAMTGWLAPGRADLGVPNIAIAIVLAVGAGVAVLAVPGFRHAVAAIPLAWLTGFHGLRALFGMVFIALFELGTIPADFAFRGGYGDIAAGILGGLTALLLVLEVRRGLVTAALLSFTTVGLSDFAVVLYTGVTTLAPGGPFDRFSVFLLIPAYVVPLFILTHVYVLARRLRERRTGVAPAAVT